MAHGSCVPPSAARLADASAFAFPVWCAVVNDSSGFTNVTPDLLGGGDFLNITAQS